jgi:hypothetical protein
MTILALATAATLALALPAGAAHAPQAWTVACKDDYSYSRASRACYALGRGVAAVVMSDHPGWPAVLIVDPGLERLVRIDDNPPLHLQEGRPGERVREEPYRTIEAQMRTGRTMLIGSQHRVPLTGFAEALDEARRRAAAQLGLTTAGPSREVRPRAPTAEGPV